jgi:hypothetical protein
MIRISKVYGAVTLSGEFESARDGIAFLDTEAEAAELIGETKPETEVDKPVGETKLETEVDKPKRHRRTKAEIEAEKALNAAKLAGPPPVQSLSPPAPVAPGAIGLPPADPNPTNAVDPAWLTKPAAPSAPQLPSFPGVPPVAPPPGATAPQLPSFPGVPPVAPPPGAAAPQLPSFPGVPPIAAPAPPPFEPENRADAHTPGWANYIDSRIEAFRAAYPANADGVLLNVVGSVVGATPPDAKTAREWLFKLASPDLSTIVQRINDATSAAIGKA